MQPTTKKTLWIVGLVFAVVFVFALLRGLSAAGHDPAKLRATAISAGLPSCVATAKAGLAVRGRTVSDATLDSYCDCAVKQMIGALSDEQLLQPGLSPEQALGPRAGEIVKSCAEKTLAH